MYEITIEKEKEVRIELDPATVARIMHSISIDIGNQVEGYQIIYGKVCIISVWVVDVSSCKKCSDCDDKVKYVLSLFNVLLPPIDCHFGANGAGPSLNGAEIWPRYRNRMCMAFGRSLRIVVVFVVFLANSWIS